MINSTINEDFIKYKQSVVLGAFRLHFFQMISKELGRRLELFAGSLGQKAFSVMANAGCFVQASLFVFEHFGFFLLDELLPQAHFLHN